MRDVDVGQVIAGRYVLKRLLGVGAMGQVWAARHRELEQDFAVKLMVPATASTSIHAQEGEQTALKRFRNEAQIAAALSRKSRHIVGVSDHGIDDGIAYLVMELLVGDGLDRRVGHGRRLYPSEVSTVATQIARGLTVAHGEGVTHRDLKPANVFLTKTEEGQLLVKLLDFGIARMARSIVQPNESRAPTKLTIKGLVLGSPGYMSPEQAMADSPDARADVWSLCVVAYEALAGATPFDATGVDETILRICNFQPTPLATLFPDASPALSAVFTRAFTRNIAERFQTPADFAVALASALPEPSRELISVRPPSPSPINSSQVTEFEGGVSLKLPMRSRKIVPVVTIGVALALALGAFVALRTSSRARDDATPKTLASHPTSSATAPNIPPPPPTISATMDLDKPDPKTPRPHATTVTTTAATTVTTATTAATATATAAPTTTKSVDRSAIF